MEENVLSFSFNPSSACSKQKLGNVGTPLTRMEVQLGSRWDLAHLPKPTETWPWSAATQLLLPPQRGGTVLLLCPWPWPAAVPAATRSPTLAQGSVSGSLGGQRCRMCLGPRSPRSLLAAPQALLRLFHAHLPSPHWFKLQARMLPAGDGNRPKCHLHINTCRQQWQWPAGTGTRGWSCSQALGNRAVLKSTFATRRTNPEVSPCVQLKWTQQTHAC